MSYRAFWQQVFALALPVAFQSALVSALAMADVLMVGHLGSQAVAAVGLAAKLNFVLIMVMAALGTGCSILGPAGTKKSDKRWHCHSVSVH